MSCRQPQKSPTGAPFSFSHILKSGAGIGIRVCPYWTDEGAHVVSRPVQSVNTSFANTASYVAGWLAGWLAGVQEGNLNIYI